MPNRSRRCVAAVTMALLIAVAAGCREKPAATPPPKAPTESAAPVVPSPINPVPSAEQGGAMTPTPPADAAPPATPFTGFAAEGEGQPTEFQANVKASLHFAGVSKELPCTMWFPGEGADSPFSFSMRHDGSGYYDFTFGPAKQACRFTDPDGRDLAVLDVKFGVEDMGQDRTRSTFRLTLVKP